jgi:hypothetical protein
MVRRRYYQDYSALRQRIQNLRAFIALKFRGYIRQLRNIYGAEYPLVETAWWYTQHIGQLKLTLTERLNRAERMLEARRLTKERIERIKTYLEETENLARRLHELARRFEELRRQPWEFEHRVLAHVLRILQGKRIAHEALPQDEQYAIERYMAYLTKQRGGASYLDLTRSGVIAEHYPKTRIRLYVHLVLSYAVVSRNRHTKHITIKTPYIVHVDDYYSNQDYYNALALQYAYNAARSRGWGLYEIEEYEIDGRIQERL